MIKPSNTGSNSTKATSNSREDNNDYLSEVLSTLNVAHSGVVFFEFSSPWAIKIEYDIPIICVVTDGELWLNQNGKNSQKYEIGDAFVLPRGTSNISYFISSSQKHTQDWITAEDLWRRGHHKQFTPSQKSIGAPHIRWGGDEGKRVRIISFAFTWQGKEHGPLVKALPQLMRLNATDTGATLLKLLANFPLEGGQPNLSGFSALTAQTAQLFLVHAIRTYAISNSSDAGGWLRGLSDPKIARALASIHEHPGNKWTVDQLAKCSGMSRSFFAQQFTRIMGESPMSYLCSWRMQLARTALARGDTSVTALALDLGYQSEAAFRSAFRKETGKSPREYIKSLSTN